ncbi:SURF1 family protein [Microbacterium indicum]|uniref:SURF1 family protein n=1 Tax=Microbacterium indicum TaxID=358100 RepID=UPI000409A6FA|nr:SURF1 family cytochrome oxidase biogenesis protein [Microbacterium indicum]
MTSETLPPEAPEFPPTLREVMLRPRWIGMLVLCLVVAAIFSVLLQWQLSRSFDTDPQPAGATEEILPLDDIVRPGEYIDADYDGQRTDVSGTWTGGDFLVVTQRVNDGAEGFWVTGHLVTDEGANLAVAVGWAETREEADAAAQRLDAQASGEVEMTGRMISDEGAVAATGDDPYEITRMSPAALLGRWGETDGPVYRAFFASQDPDGGVADVGLTAISSPAPEAESPVNWLNLFYAVEWAIFAAFSFYLWYRLAKDAWERELEEFAGVDPDALDDED